MRAAANVAKIHAFMAALGSTAKSPGCIYLTGGATALLHGWRASTVDVDLKADPEPQGMFEAIAQLKDTLDVNVELAAPDQFIPALPGWRERSSFIAAGRVLSLRPLQSGAGQVAARPRARRHRCPGDGGAGLGGTDEAAGTLRQY